MAVVEISGIRIPDSRLAREASEFVREMESTLLFEHSTRVYFWGAMAGQRRWTTSRCPWTSAVFGRM